MNFVWDDNREDILFWGTESDLKQLNSLIKQCIDVLNTSNNPREIVLETWLTLDYALRKFLLSGFELSRFCGENFELEYILLPSSFKALLELFENTVKYNSKFSLQSDPIQPDRIGGFKSSHEFWTFIRDKHLKLYKSIVQVTREYQLEKNPDLRDAANEGKNWAISPIDHLEHKAQTMNLGWRQQASLFDESWFKLARRLNDARNKAAHSIDPQKISQKFGINNPNPLEAVRNQCQHLLNRLLAVRNKDDI